jgi:hypothetical protein
MQAAALSASQLPAKRTSLIKANFLEAFRRYVDNNQDLETVGTFLGKGRSSVHRYYSGAACPSLSDIRRFCDKLGWDFESLASHAEEVDKVFAQQWLSFETLAHRLLSRRKVKDVSGAWQIISMAGARLHGHLVLHSIPCKLTIEKDFEVRIIFEINPILIGLWLVFQFNPEQGLIIRLEYIPVIQKDRKAQGQCAAEYYPYTDEGIEFLVERLTVKNHGKNTT